MSKFIKFPSGPEIAGIVVIIVAWQYVWNKFVPASVKNVVS